MAGGNKENIVMFPFMAQGHIIPFLALALKLEQKQRYSITFVNTPVNIKKLRSNLPSNSSIRLLEIPFDSTEHGLPPFSESTETLPLPLMVRLIEASPSLQPAFSKLISNLVNEQKGVNSTPFCVISDMFFAWSAEVAHKFGLSHAIFTAGGGYGMAVFHTTWLNLPHLKEKSDEFFQIPNFPKGYKFEVKNLPPHVQEASGPWDFLQTVFQDWLKTDAMLFNTVEEMDSTGLSYFRQQFSCPIYAIGPIISPAGSKARAGNEAETTLQTCMKWLDSKPENSVLYVAFGSHSSPSVPQIHQLATALESSDVNFLWIVRPPSSFHTNGGINGDNNNWLPKGFEDRIESSKKGLMIQKWAPQMEILSHKSIGGFLSHCGWNSSIEALSNGVPMLSWPMGAEQPYNAKMLEEELSVCIGVANGMACEVKYEEISEKIKVVMKETKGKELRFNALKVKEIIENANNDCENCCKGSSVRAFDEFLDAAIEMRNKLTKCSLK